MKSLLPKIFVLSLLVGILAVLQSCERIRTIDWEESFNEKSNKPYGVSVFYKELPKIFKNQKVRTVYHQPSSYLSANSEDGYGEHIAKGSYIIIGNSTYLYDDSVNELLSFVDAGNTLLMSSYSFPQIVYDTLNVSTDYIANKKDSISYLSLKHVDIDDITIDRNDGDMYFTHYDSINYNVLGHSKIDYKHVNFLQIPFGAGNIYLHLEPKVFTNYNLLKEDRYKYAEGIISYLQENNIYFDSYTKIQTSYDGDVEKESDYSWFMQQTAFRWAWYTAIIFGILFMIFNAKRRQRIIKIIKPLQNTTVAFVKTISNLYFDTKDHKNLIDKKITYFLEKIRTDFNLNTTVLNDDFIEKLASKTGKKKEDVTKLINLINLLKSKHELLEDDLIKLNRYIESFYSK
ncbi:DUF4350 domain-containing protein [uncultured Algibacter sp.]|uniref:DUF4350 domain-containing protein n=1 Tax=uncultured Algibacter sp. TaxID=298659 RepID=UPI0032175F3E